jgi:hypothetical protein
MVLPPGRSGIPVSGIDDSSDPELARAAGELNAWIDYLLHPETNDGPRIYRDKVPRLGKVEREEMELPRRQGFAHPEMLETLSVLRDYASDTDAFFRPARAVSGVNEQNMEQTYDKLCQGFFTWDNKGPRSAGENRAKDSIVAQYQEMNVARDNWMQMRNGSGWIAPENQVAHEFENDFINFQLYTENCFYVIAEHLVRYRAIFEKSSQDIKDLMFGLTDKFAAFDPFGGGGGLSFDFVSIVVTGIVAATTTVITGGAAAGIGVVALATAVEAVGEAAKTAESSGKNEFRLESPKHLRDVARQYLDAVNKIEQDAAAAIHRLVESLRTEVVKLRTGRIFEAIPGTGRVVETPPHFPAYLAQIK